MQNHRANRLGNLNVAETITFRCCLSFAGLLVGAVVLIAVLNPLGFWFFAVMFTGIAAGGLSDAQFKPREAIVQKYETHCAPNPGLISASQPKCIVDGKDGAMLRIVTLSIASDDGHWENRSTHYPASWEKPSIGGHVTVFVNQRDAAKFKLDPQGWIIPGY